MSASMLTFDAPMSDMAKLPIEIPKNITISINLQHH
jgi:hypothetical protein